MLHTVYHEFKNRSEHTLFLSPCSGTKSQIEGIGYKTIDFPLKHVTDYRGFAIFYYFGNLIKYLRKSYRGQLPIEKIDAVMDISGFAYSDQWGEKAVYNVNTLIDYFKKNKAEYYFLPQAFGPFSGKKMRKGMIDAIKKAKYISARDKVSYNMLIELIDTDKIHMNPDITISLGATKTKGRVLKSDYVCIVPNERMLDQGKEFWHGNSYLDYLKKAITIQLTSTENHVFIVVHDKGAGDTMLAKKVASLYKEETRVELLFEDDPIALKSILGKSKLVIGSRFHALVSSLSQNIPSVALGWSHKYQMLFEEYGIEKYAFEKPKDDLFKENLELLVDEGKRKALIEKIRNTNILLKEKNDEMWNEIIRSLNNI